MQATGIAQGLIYRKNKANLLSLLKPLINLTKAVKIFVTHVIAWWIRVRGRAQLSSLAIEIASLMKVRMTLKVKCIVKGPSAGRAHDIVLASSNQASINHKEKVLWSLEQFVELKWRARLINCTTWWIRLSHVSGTTSSWPTSTQSYFNMRRSKR